MIEKTLAQNIVDRLKTTIHQELNFFSIKGDIIASTDPTRIGQTGHEGALRAISDKKAIIIEHDQQYPGAKAGINLPLIVDKRTIGAIGITGPKEEVLHFGEIIKQMTEVLLINSMTQEIIHNRRILNQNIIAAILQDKDISATSEELLGGIDLNIPRMAIVGFIFSDRKRESDNDFSSLYSAIENLFSRNHQHLLELRGNQITLLFHTASKKKASDISSKLSQLLANQFSLPSAFGIGRTANTPQLLKQSIKQAQAALRWAKTHTNTPIFFYEEMEEGIILNHIPSHHRNFFLQSIFKDLSHEDIDTIIKLVTTYISHNGSIQKGAEALFIHKNTFQYQLNRIAQLTGYNPRNFQDLFILHLASLLYQTQAADKS